MSNECPVCERVRVMLKEALNLLEEKSERGCATCEKGQKLTPETAYLHTGFGEFCTVSIEELEKKAQEDETKLNGLREQKPRRGPGRPRKAAMTPEREAELRAKADAAQAETMKNHKPPIIDDERRRTVEPPRWCRCGRPVTWDGKVWECQSGHKNPLENLLQVNVGVPGERIDLLCNDVCKHVEVSLLEVASWSTTKRDVVRALIAQDGDVKGYLVPESSPTQEVEPFGF